MYKTCCIFAFILLLETCQISCLAKRFTNLTTDQFALIDFKSRITSDPYDILRTNWSSSSSVCSWIGVSCGMRHQRVISLNISNMGASGTISPQLGNLSFLTAVDLGFNQFSGTLPLELSLLHRLKFISVRSNNLVGEIPLWLGVLPRLEHLSLRNNSFTGSIPIHLSNLSNLQLLDFSFNSLDGEIPQELGTLRDLQILRIRGNQLSGVIPSAIFNISTLQVIAFSSNELSGGLPNELCAHLPFLRELYLGLNKMSGQIPTNVSECSHLQVLSLAYNLFDGRIPAAIGELTALQSLQFGGNNLKGDIPQEIGNLQNLITLGLERNEITGRLPTNISSLLQDLYLGQNILVGDLQRAIRNLTALRFVDIPYNYFTGVLPRGLVQLELLHLTYNKLSGIVPHEIFNISTLESLQLSGNALSGPLPTNMCYGSRHLETLFLGQNQLNGVIPDSLSNCSSLKGVDIGVNKFTTFKPHIFGELPLLELLNLSGENLGFELSSLLTSLTSCRYLIRLHIGNNLMDGIIPTSVGNLSSSLQYFDVYDSNVKGSIDPGIGNLSNLVRIALHNNDLSGNIPPTFKHLYKLQVLILTNNSIRGPIPEGLCGLHNLNAVVFRQNKLSGPIPECLGNLTTLRNLYIDSNKLSSSIPSTLWGLKDLLELDLSSNNLSGQLPILIQDLVAAIYINLSINQLSGSIPTTIGNLLNLANLSLAQNRLQGSIPTSMGSMLSLATLDLSQNNLSGSIPKSLEVLQYLEYFNVSFNDLSGEIPTGGPFTNFTMESFKPNEALCGAPRFNVSPCYTVSPHSSTKKVELALFIVAGLVVLVAIVCLAIIFTKCRKKESRGGEVAELTSVVPERISYYEIVRATEGFSESNILGIGSLGSVFKGVVRDGNTIAVKVFRLQSEAALRSFDVECEVLRNIRHRNLIKVISSCSNESFKALVLEYMPKGNLEKWLYSHNYCLDVVQRLNIMIDVASALEYLHHGHPTPIIHCDVKPSNVLLDEEMIAHVSDFGIAKLLGTDESNVLTNTLATLGYIAPEYGVQGLVSTKCDVYSYGIMLMETFTRRRPSDDIFGGEMSLRSWVERQSTHEIIDANLVNPQEQQLDHKLKCVSSVLKLGLKCASESSKDRINMKQALVELHKIKHLFLH